MVLVKAPSANSYRRYANIFGNSNKQDEKFEAFIIGTSLYRLGIISQEEEIHAYHSFIEKLEGQNEIKKILWKPHPRMDKRCEIFVKDFKKVTMITDDTPIELLFSRNRAEKSLSASIASSALLSGWLYFGITPIILDVKLSGLERFPHILKMQKIVPVQGN